MHFFSFALLLVHMLLWQHMVSRRVLAASIIFMTLPASSLPINPLKDRGANWLNSAVQV